MRRMRIAKDLSFSLPRCHFLQQKPTWRILHLETFLIWLEGNIAMAGFLEMPCCDQTNLHGKGCATQAMSKQWSLQLASITLHSESSLPSSFLCSPTTPRGRAPVMARHSPSWRPKHVEDQDCLPRKIVLAQCFVGADSKVPCLFLRDGLASREHQQMCGLSFDLHCVHSTAVFLWWHCSVWKKVSHQICVQMEAHLLFLSHLVFLLSFLHRDTHCAFWSGDAITLVSPFCTSLRLALWPAAVPNVAWWLWNSFLKHNHLKKWCHTNFEALLTQNGFKQRGWNTLTQKIVVITVKTSNKLLELSLQKSHLEIYLVTMNWTVAEQCQHGTKDWLVQQFVPLRIAQSFLKCACQEQKGIGLTRVMARIKPGNPDTKTVRNAEDFCSLPFWSVTHSNMGYIQRLHTSTTTS